MFKQIEAWNWHGAWMFVLIVCVAAMFLTFFYDYGVGRGWFSPLYDKDTDHHWAIKQAYKYQFILGFIAGFLMVLATRP